MYFKENDIVFHKSTGKFYRIGYVSNNGSYKLYGLYDGKLLWNDFWDKNLILDYRELD